MCNTGVRRKIPNQLMQHTIISASSISPSVEWKFKQNSEITTIRIKPRLVVTTNDAAIEAASTGFGITRLMSYQIAPQLANNTLQIILPEYELAPLPVHVIHREGRHKSARVRSFVDLMVEGLRAKLAV
jgi:DNA-binding transcriptional LysR family regulator